MSGRQQPMGSLASRHAETPLGHVCVCGQPATTTVSVAWANGERRYRYCEECAADITETIDGTEVLP